MDGIHWKKRNIQRTLQHEKNEKKLIWNGISNDMEYLILL
jgi:hypothetical protein